jgi:DNA-directed RNA polymerase subunit RPC12/RpoP
MTAELLTPVKLHTNLYKACQRCGGTLRLERDLDSLVDHDAYEYVCLQCGRHTSLASVLARVQGAEKVVAA